jgi:hypothetical protein
MPLAANIDSSVSVLASIVAPVCASIFVAADFLPGALRAARSDDREAAGGTMLQVEFSSVPTSSRSSIVRNNLRRMACPHYFIELSFSRQAKGLLISRVFWKPARNDNHMLDAASRQEGRGCKR